jgi:hypothetical protein
MVVPPEAGGLKVESNGILLCRACEMAADAASRVPGSEGAKRWPLNFLVSRSLYERMERLRERRYRSFGSLVRYLMSSFVLDCSRFDDVCQYQDGGSDTKVNVWVPKQLYDTFRTLVTAQGMTVTDALKGLILMIDEANRE